jgi:hypothetical protein
MAHFAEIDKNNIVLRVLVTDNNDPNGDEGHQWLIDNLGGIWIKTSYNENIRKNFASPGFLYDEDKDTFIPIKPFESWILDEDTCKWKAPVEKPNDKDYYTWDEENVSWKKLEIASEPIDQ